MADGVYRYFALSDVPIGDDGYWGLIRQRGPVVERFFPGVGWGESPSHGDYVFRGEPGASLISPEHALALQEAGTLVVLNAAAIKQLTAGES